MADQRLHVLVLNVEISAGTGTFCKNLGTGLRREAEAEIKASLLVMRPRQLTNEERCAYEEVHTLGAAVSSDWRRFYQTPLDLLRLRQALKRIEPDIVFCIGTYSNLLASLAAGPQRTIMSEHMNMTLRTEAARFGGVMRKLMRWRYPRSMMVVAARGIAEDLRVNFGVDQVRIIPNGLDPQRIRDLAENAATVRPTEQPYFIAVGRLTPQKDFPTLLRAHAEAKKRGMGENLVIAGDGELRPELERIARELEIAPSVHFLGHVSNPYPLIKQARALILSSVFEGFAYVPLEAMALGVPVISTDCPSGPSDILGDGEYGTLVPPSDPVALGRAMHELSISPALQQNLSERSRIRSAHLTVEAMARAYRDLFLEHARSWPRL